MRALHRRRIQLNEGREHAERRARLGASQALIAIRLDLAQQGPREGIQKASNGLCRGVKDCERNQRAEESERVRHPHADGQINHG